jgi:hypothetical protein
MTSKENNIKFEPSLTRNGLYCLIKVEVPAKYSGEEAMKVIEFDVIQKNMGGGYINSALSFVRQIQVELIVEREYISMVIKEK